jgi:predicted ATPase
MVEFDIAITNYRCFSTEETARLQMRRGLTSLVGPNNAGKSALLRLFFELREVFRLLQDHDVLRGWSRGEGRGIAISGVGDQAEVFHNRNRLPVRLAITFPSASRTQISGVELAVERASSANWFAKFKVGPHFEELNSGDEFPHLNERGNRIRLDTSLLTEFAREVSSALYLPASRVAIGESQGNSFDLTFGAGFIALWDMWKTGPNRGQNEAIQEVTSDIAELFGFSNFDITATPDKRDLHVNIDGRAFKLRELGAGLAQFVIVLGNVATKRPAWLLIDEPEISLHPQLQLDFLTTLASYVDGGVLFATHSLGLARNAERIFSVSRSDGRSVLRPFEQTGSFQEFLGEMSFAAYRDLGFDSVLLVEGVNDIKTAQQLLRTMRKDHRVVVLQLGGAQMIRPSRVAEVSEVLRLTKRAFVLIDSEKASADVAISKDRQEFLAACKEAGITAVATERRALEHYLPDSAIKAAFGSKYRALHPFEDRSTPPVVWAKSESWRAAREMTADELAACDIGRLFDQI